MKKIYWAIVLFVCSFLFVACGVVNGKEDSSSFTYTVFISIIFPSIKKGILAILADR